MPVSNGDMDAAFASLEEKRAGAVFVSANELFARRRVQFATWRRISDPRNLFGIELSQKSAA